jgi:transposase
MARAYSLELREKVLSFVVRGGSKRKAAQVFNVGEDTIYRWLRLKKTGDIQAKKRTQFSSKVPHTVLISYVQNHPDQTLKEIGQGIGLSVSKVWKHLKKLGITRKKRRPVMLNGVKKNGLSSKNK